MYFIILLNLAFCTWELASSMLNRLVLEFCAFLSFQEDDEKNSTDWHLFYSPGDLFLAF